MDNKKFNRSNYTLRLLPLILLLSLAAQAQPGGYTEGTQVCWQFNSRDHGYFRAVGWNSATDHILIFFPGDGETSCANYDGMEPGLILRDGAGGSNWNGVTTLPAEAGGGSRKWMVFTMTNHGNQPDVYAADISEFLNSIGETIDASWSGRIHYAGGSGGPGRANAFFNNTTSNPYRTFHSTGIWMSTALYTVSSNSPAKNYCWYGDADTNPGTPPSFTINVYNQLPGVENVDKFLGVTVGGGHSNTTWGDCMDISGTTVEDNRWIWMIVEGEDLIEDPTYPETHKIQLDFSMWFDIVGTVQKSTELLIDGDTTTSGYPNFFDGYVITTNHNEGLWIKLDSFINTPKIRVFNNNNSSIDVGFQFYYSRSDTTRHSPWYYADLPDNGWSYVDSFNSRAWSDSVRWIKIDVPDIPTGFCEIQVYGNTLGVAPSVYPSSQPEPDDPGKFFMGYGKVFTDTLTDDAGYTQRHQGDAGRIDTALRTSQLAGGTWTDGKTLVVSDGGNSEELTYQPAKRNGRKQWSYFANIRKAFEDPIGNVQRKDILPFSDSTDLASWVYVERMHFAVAAWFGFNTSVNTTGYSIINIPGAERGRGYFDYIEIGNEDMQHWNGPNKFHSPRVQYLKIKAGYNGAKAADPNIKVIVGAFTGVRPDRFRALWFMHYWYYQEEASTFPADAIAFNEYSTTAGGQHGSDPPYDGVPPEIFNLKAKLDSNVTIRDQFFPGKELFCTEFGYDGYAYGVVGSNLDTTDHNSNYNVPDIPGQTRDQTKSYWTMRWYEILASSRWSRAMQYSQRSLAGGDFATTGFSYDIALPGNPSTYLPAYMQQFIPGRWTTGGCCSTLPSDLYWYMTCRAYRLRDFNAWPSIIANGDSTDVWVQRYTHTSDADSLIYSVWMGTSDNSTTSNYVINIPNVQTATLVTPALGDKDGSTTVLNITGSDVTVPTVNEGVQYILVTVDAGANQSPTAAAGTDQTITLPTSQVTVNGSSSSDPDGTISTYLWTKISGPATFTITNANIASTTITGLVQGTYVFRLTVTDNESATDTDDITITVNAAAGPSNTQQFFRGSLKNKFRN